MTFRVDSSHINQVRDNNLKINSQKSESVKIDLVQDAKSNDVMSIKHSESEPLTEEQKNSKMLAKQKQLDEIAQMKKAAANQDTVKMTKEKFEILGNVYDVNVKSTYDSEGKIKQKQIVFPDGKSRVYEYDEDGKEQFIRLYSENGTLTKEMEFDKMGNRLRNVQYFDNGMLYSTETNEYHQNGQLKSHKYTADLPPDKPEGVIISERFDNLEPMVNSGRGDLHSSVIENYDENGNLLYEFADDKFSSGELSFYETGYEYDNNGNLVKETKKTKSKLPELDVPAEINEVTTYEYNSDNILIRQTKTDLDSNEVYSSDYTPDMNMKSPRPGKELEEQ